MRIDIITLFPDMFAATLDESILARARKKGALQLCCHQLRDFSELAHNRVDDTVFGGGKGMLLMAEPIANCIDEIAEHTGAKPKVVYMSPRGQVLNQEKAKELSKIDSLVILCGHYEGVDERLLEEYEAEEISIGDFVLTGGEIPAMVLVDSVCRMIDGVLADEDCFTEESHYNGLLEYPQYTKPSTWRERSVPDVVLSGHHAHIAKWRKEESLKLTSERRPDMYDRYLKDNKDK